MQTNPEQDVPFWKRKTLAEMTPEEWESLCDGCARCCLYKLQDEDSGVVEYTNVVCRLIDPRTLRCTRYRERAQLMPTCLVMTPQLAHQLTWMPSTCAYRLLAEGKDLPAWHPLVSADPNSVYAAGISVRGKVNLEQAVDMDDLEDYIVSWLD